MAVVFFLSFFFLLLSFSALEASSQELQLNTHKTQLSNNYLERMVEERTDQLLKKNQDIRNLVYLMSHDMRENIRTISGFFHLFKQKISPDELNKTQQEQQFITIGIKRMDGIIRDVIQFTSVEKIEKVTPIPVEQLLENCLQHVAPLIEKRHVQIYIKKLPEIIIGDAEQLQMVCNHIVTNAIQHNPSENPTIEIEGEEKTDYWIFSITDNGIGIPAKFQDKIFEPFKKLDNKLESEGSGVGLAICRRIVENHGGTIWFKSKKDRGTTLKFTIHKAILTEAF